MIDTAHWITIAHLEKWGYEKINDLIIKVFHIDKSNWADFFNLREIDWKNEYKLADSQIIDLVNARNNIENNFWLADQLMAQGYELIPINSANYSKQLKKNLKKKAPPLLYIKGNKQILQKKAVAIVGSRNANDQALKFTDNIAKRAAEEQKTIVSGFAKGTDKQALDSAIFYNAQSIIVLPQGIMTFELPHKKYLAELENGNILILSVFNPYASWKNGLAIARNIIIYGLAEEIFIAQTSDSGGTWQGAVNGLKKERTIFIRKPDETEDSANNLLIKAGAIPVDFYGNKIQQTENQNLIYLHKLNDTLDTLETQILFALRIRPLTVRQIIKILNLQITSQKLSSLLKKINHVEIIEKTKPQIFKLRDHKYQTLF